MDKKYFKVEQERVGATLAFIRKLRGLTQGELAEQVNVSRSFIALIERGTRPIPEPLLLPVCTALMIKPIVLVNPLAMKIA